jgi:hypothetical protein
MSDLVGVPCSVCSERGHHSRKCPDLTDPLRPGFSGASGGGGHGGGDDEEDHLPLVPYLPCVVPIITPTLRRITTSSIYMIM